MGPRSSTPSSEPVSVRHTNDVSVKHTNDSTSRLTTVLINGWRNAAAIVGGEKRLRGAVVTVVLLLGAWVWWRQPPSASSIYDEFLQCHVEVEELRRRGITSAAEWERAVARPRAKIQSLVSRLRDPKTGASAAQPAKQELLWAGEQQLLKLLASPTVEPGVTDGLERQFDRRMSEARRLIDGGTLNPAIAGPTTADMGTSAAPPPGRGPDTMTGGDRTPAPNQATPTHPDGQTGRPSVTGGGGPPR